MLLIILLKITVVIGLSRIQEQILLCIGKRDLLNIECLVWMCFERHSIVKKQLLALCFSLFYILK